MQCTESAAYAAYTRLKAGNEHYLTLSAGCGDVSWEIRARTAAFGQAPFAAVLTCSDSRVIPEAIFHAGIGELFVIRVAGNVVDRHVLGSIQYAVEHLGCPLVLVMGHTNCGAVDAAIRRHAGGYIRSIVDDIRDAIGDETDARQACLRNIRRSVTHIRRCLELPSGESTSVPLICGALYDLERGVVDFLDVSFPCFEDEEREETVCTSCANMV